MSAAVENPEDALQAALSAPFAPNHIPRAAVQTPAQRAEHQQDVPNMSSKPITRSAELDAEAAAARDESWKAEYDRHLRSWQEEAAVRREAAEKERERWEKLKQEQGTPIPDFAANPTDASGLVTGEREGGHGAAALNDVLAPSAHQQTTQHPTTVSGSGDDPTTSPQTWEQVGSTESSYPSLSFPNTPPHAPQSYTQAWKDFHAPPPPPPPPPVHPPSVTISIFDSSLSRRARVLALVSSLTINLLLPFINGVMLGFGEIFARHLIKWNGWSNVASFVGLRSPSSKVEAIPPPLSGPPPRRPR